MRKKTIIDPAISFKRGTYMQLRCKLEGCGTWFATRGVCTTQSARVKFKELAKHYNTNIAEIKIDDDAAPVVMFGKIYDMEKDKDYYFFQNEKYERIADPLA